LYVVKKYVLSKYNVTNYFLTPTHLTYLLYTWSSSPWGYHYFLRVPHVFYFHWSKIKKKILIVLSEHFLAAQKNFFLQKNVFFLRTFFEVISNSEQSKSEHYGIFRERCCLSICPTVSLSLPYFLISFVIATFWTLLIRRYFFNK